MVPNTRPAARPPKTRRSSNSVWSTRGRSNRRRETQRIPMPGRIPRRNATKKSRFEAIVAGGDTNFLRCAAELQGYTELPSAEDLQIFEPDLCPACRGEIDR